MIILVAAVNYHGIRRGAVLQNLSTVFKVGALAALVLLGFAARARRLSGRDADAAGRGSRLAVSAGDGLDPLGL